MMPLLRKLPPFLLVLILTTSCFTIGEKCRTYGARIPDIRLEQTNQYSGCSYEGCVDPNCLGEHGEPYHHRASILLDASCFQPYPDESYSVYFDRMMRTMQAQEAEAARLMKATADKESSISDLDTQLADLESQHVDLRVALAGMEEEEAQRQSTVALFSKYTVQPGDTLQSISFERYNTHKGWLNIFRFNLHRLPQGPNQIEEGQVLLIPSTIEAYGSDAIQVGSG